MPLVLVKLKPVYYHRDDALGNLLRYSSVLRGRCSLSSVRLYTSKRIIAR